MASLRKMAIDLTPLRTSRDFRLLFIGSTVSAIGTQFTRVTVPYLIYRQTHSTFALGIIGGITLLPMLVSSIVGGALADVIERRRLARFSAAVGALCSIVHALNASIGQPRVWLLYVIHVIATCVTMGGAPAMRSALPFLVDEKELPSALMVQSTTYTSSSVFGPMLAGIVIGSIGARWAFVIDAATFGWSFVCLTLMRPIPPAHKGGPVKVSGGFIIDGFRSLRGRKPIIGSFLADVNAMVFGMPIALLPAVHAQRFAAHGGYFGLLYAAIPTGMFLASLFSGWTRNVTRHGLVVVSSVVVWGVAIVVFGVVHSIVPTLICLAVAGAADMISGVSRQAMLQLSATPELQGRLQGVGMAVWTSGPALGDLEAGTVASLWSVDASIWSGGALCVLGIVVLALALPEFARFDSSSHSEPSIDGEPAIATAPA